MRLDDIEQADDTSYTHLLKQIRVLRGVAKDIIQFLAQLENFQKKLWLKKKFVTEANYCITLDRLAGQPELLEAALTNEEQRQEWVKLFSIDLNELDRSVSEGVEVITAHEEFRYLVLDTRFFEPEFRDALLSRIDELDENINGIMIHSVNFHALKLVQESLRHQIKCIYADPPYNTGSDGFVYKDGYKSASWLSLIASLIPESEQLQGDDSFFAMSIDKRQQFDGKLLIDSLSGMRFINSIVNVNNPKGRSDQKHLPTAHDNILLYASDNSVSHGWIPQDKVLKRYSKQDSEGKYREIDLRKTGDKDLESDRPSMFYGFAYNELTGELRLEEDLEQEESDFIVIYPMKSSTVKGRWRWQRSTSKSNLTRLIAKYQPQKEQWSIFEKDYLGDDERVLPTSVWDEKPFNSERATEVFTSLGFDKEDFPRPKAVGLLEHLFEHIGLDSKYIFDYFAGSGTSGHAVINLNRRGLGQHNYILCEMGAYFDSVTKPRIQKAIYSADWKDGKPVIDSDGRAGGISQSFKYLRLEQYEDTLNNLIDSLSYNSDTVPKDFILSYLLDAETAESPSLLNLEQFSQPRKYKLQIKKPNSDQSSPQVIDLVETFNWLIGLHVEKLDKWRAYDCEFEREHDPELPQDQNTRLKVTHMKQTNAYADDAPLYQVRMVEGWVRQVPGNDELRDKVLVIWRNLSDDSEKDSAFLEAIFEKQRINQSDSEFDKIYVNGPHGLQLHGSAKTRLLSLEDTFMTKMWEDA